MEDLQKIKEFFSKNLKEIKSITGVEPKNQNKINALKKYREQVMRDMEQEAELEGGPIADKYGAELNKIDKAITKLEGHGEWGPETDPHMSKAEIERRAAMLDESMGGELDEKLFVRVAPESKALAYEIFKNNGYINISPGDSRHIKRYGSKFKDDIYASNSIEDIYDFYYDLVANGAIIEDENVTDIDYDVPLDEIDEITKGFGDKISAETFSKLKGKMVNYYGNKYKVLDSDEYTITIEDEDGETETINLNQFIQKGLIPELKKIVQELITEKKKKRDRCLRIADRRYKKPSAYKSGAVTRCRDGEIWVGIKEDLIKEKAKETLRTWFSRQGAPGKTGGWVDCNSPIYKDGKKKGYKSCGRQKDEKRAKYPSCRPTAAQCSTPGKGKKWGKTK